jgi:hypothetical protein
MSLLALPKSARIEEVSLRGAIHRMTKWDRGIWPVRCAAAVALIAAGSGVTVAQHEPSALQTNEAEITELYRPSALAIDDPLAVFAFVLGQLPERVQVFPTENYYYFRFAHQGTIYSGNILLAVTERDQGRISFAYGELPWDWGRDPKVHHMLLGDAQGVSIEKVGSLDYRVSFRGKSVTFALNDLKDHKPPPNLLNSSERLIGPIFDESGIRFFLVFNQRIRVFHYLLDETVPVAEQFYPAKVSDRILIGKRTGFALYRDGNRKILIGVRERDSRLNTYFDGPFDQLPLNFIEGEALRDAIVAAVPQAKGQIDRLGKFINRPGRFLIHPYLLYRDERDLAVFHRCLTDRRIGPAERPACFVISDEEQQQRRPLPLALQRR